MAWYGTLLLLLAGLAAIFVSIVWQLRLGLGGKDLERVESKCESGNFRLPGMTTCEPLLRCSQISREVEIKETIGQGAVKQVKRGTWKTYSVAVNILANAAYRDDFLHGLRMLHQLQSTVNVTQLVGLCEEKDIFITEFHPLGSADRLELVLKTSHHHAFNTLSVRFGLCLDYVKILHSLHSGIDDGARVMCDSNDLSKTLSQFLLSDNFSLILNDVDALPLANRHQGQVVKCGHRELFGEFVAPEQLWPHEDRDFVDSELAGYDEKVDIWKVPDACEAFLGNTKGSSQLRLQLLSVHLKCKNVNPSERPSASDLLDAYHKVREKLHL